MTGQPSVTDSMLRAASAVFLSADLTISVPPLLLRKALEAALECQQRERGEWARAGAVGAAGAAVGGAVGAAQAGPTEGL